MIKKFLNWIKGLFGTTGIDYRFVKAEEEPVVLEESAAKEAAQHCGSHSRFRKNCLDCLRVVAAI